MNLENGEQVSVDGKGDGGTWGEEKTAKMMWRPSVEVLGDAGKS